MPVATSSPDPLQDLDGPSIYHTHTPAPRTFKRTSSMAAASPRPTANKKLSHTTVVSTPTRSPWRIRVVVEAERDSGAEDGEERGTVKRLRTKTTKVPLRGLSPEPEQTAMAMQKRKVTPVRRRRRSTTATPGGPGRTPGKRGRGATLEMDVDEGIGSMISGMGALEEDGDVVALAPVAEVHSKHKATPRKATPRKTPAKSRSKSPSKPDPKSPRRSPRKAAPKAPPPPEPESEEEEPDARRALSPVHTNTNMLSSTQSPRKRLSRSPAKRPLDFNALPSSPSGNDDMEGFSMIDTGSLIPGFMNSLNQSSHHPYQQDAAEFTFMSGGTSYTPYKHPEAQQEEVFADDAVGAETFYGSGAGAEGAFRSSPPPPVEFGRLKLKKKGRLMENAPLLLPPQTPQLSAAQGAPASSTRKRKRDTPELDSEVSVSARVVEVEEEEEEQEEGGYDDGVEDDDTEDEQPVLPEAPSTKGKGKAKPPPTPRPATPRAAFATETEEALWALSSPEKRLEASWAAERAAVSRRAREVGTVTIGDSEIEEDSIEAERIVEDMWLAEAEPRSEDSPAKGRVYQVRLGEEDVDDGAGAGAGALEETYRSSPQQEEEEGDSYGAAPAGTTTLLAQDTAAFEESLLQREQRHVPPSGNLFLSGTPYQRGSSISVSDGRETASSKSSPPSAGTGAKTGRWRGAPQVTPATKLMGPPPKPTPKPTPASVPAKAIIATAKERREARARQRAEAAAATEAVEPADTVPAKAVIATARERREVRARQRAEAAAAAAAEKEAEEPPVVIDLTVEGLNMLTEDLLTPPVDPVDSVPAPPVDPTPPVFPTPVSTPPSDLPTPPLSFASTVRIPSPPRVGPSWEKRHWRLLEKLLRSRKTVPPAGSRLTYSISIDDPSALDSDPEGLLADPELTVTTMADSGEWALVLGPKEVEAVRRFRERMKAEGAQREQWGVEEVAAKVGALMLAGVRRRRRVEKEKRRVEEKGKGKGKGKGKEEEKAEIGRVEMQALRAERRKGEWRRGWRGRLSGWL